MTQERDPTRREFLLDMARRSVYAAPLVMTFNVAPALAAVQGMSSVHKHKKAPTQTGPARGEQAPARPSDKYRPRDRPER